MLTPSQSRERKGSARIETRRVHLRCPACAQEKAFDLDARRLAQVRVNGKLEAHCSYCGGSNLWEPVKREELSESAPAEPKHVLLVGSDPSTLRLVAEMLGAWDARVDVVRSGQEAFRQLATISYDLLISDFRLDDLTVPAFLEIVAGLMPAERIVFLAEESRTAMQQFLDASGCAYCRKPVSFAELSQQVEGLLTTSPAQGPESPGLVI
jgi:CheY-like chemotaxis protein